MDVNGQSLIIDIKAEFKNSFALVSVNLIEY